MLSMRCDSKTVRLNQMSPIMTVRFSAFKGPPLSVQKWLAQWLVNATIARRHH